MAKRKSQAVIDLEAEVKALGAYREAFFCMRAGEKPVELSSGEGEDRRTVELLGPSRASGGVVISGATVLYATDWLLAARHSGDFYIREVARLVERGQTKAIHERIRGRMHEAGITSLPEAEKEEREARRKAGLEWLTTAPDALVDGDEDAFDEELRAHGLRWEDGRDERRNRKAKREAEARASTWARCRAAVPDGATLIDPGTEGYRGFWGWVRGRDPRAWRSVVVRPGYIRADDAVEARVIGEGNDDAGTLLDVADAIAAGTMRFAGPDEHVPPRAVVLRIRRVYTEILRVELDGKVVWAGEPAFGDLLVLDDAGHVVRTKALRKAAERAWWAKRFGGSAG